MAIYLAKKMPYFHFQFHSHEEWLKWMEIARYWLANPLVSLAFVYLVLSKKSSNAKLNRGYHLISISGENLKCLEPDHTMALVSSQSSSLDLSEELSIADTFDTTSALKVKYYYGSRTQQNTMAKEFLNKHLLILGVFQFYKVGIGICLFEEVL